MQYFQNAVVNRYVKKRLISTWSTGNVQNMDGGGISDLMRKRGINIVHSVECITHEKVFGSKIH